MLSSGHLREGQRRIPGRVDVSRHLGWLFNAIELYISSVYIGLTFSHVSETAKAFPKHIFAERFYVPLIHMCQVCVFSY